MLITPEWTNVRLVLPDGYIQRGNSWNKTTHLSTGTFEINPIHVDDCMDFSDLSAAREAVYDTLDPDDKGLVECKTGTTSWGYPYVYAITKLAEEPEYPTEADYFLTFQIKLDDICLGLTGKLQDTFMKGIRDDEGIRIALESGLPEYDESHFWLYDGSEFLPRSLAELPGMDNLFPFSALAQAHELIHALVQDELMDQPEVNLKKFQEMYDSLSPKEQARLVFSPKAERIFQPVKVEL